MTMIFMPEILRSLWLMEVIIPFWPAGAQAAGTKALRFYKKGTRSVPERIPQTINKGCNRKESGPKAGFFASCVV
ncbi:MAG: hypothetical protein IJ343_12945, partial [Clostridia bacterium]|nr:hypothetical protein [Clostridia bacterium]